MPYYVDAGGKSELQQMGDELARKVAVLSPWQSKHDGRNMWQYALACDYHNCCCACMFKILKWGV